MTTHNKEFGLHFPEIASLNPVIQGFSTLAAEPESPGKLL